ncbi:hypothetical protein HMPREF1508_0717 [Shuttleworthella sp. MSX8B]|nr:hypothetical protein HMPREF1508_0717 [Shuttleworthia sp. MSX8B]
MRMFEIPRQTGDMEQGRTLRIFLLAKKSADSTWYLFRE